LPPITDVDLAEPAPVMWDDTTSLNERI
jgi:hypothetical protein